MLLLKVKVLSVSNDDVDADADAVDPDNDADVSCEAAGKIARMTSLVRLCHRPAVGRQMGWDGMGCGYA